jgi:hypothetical protein
MLIDLALASMSLPEGRDITTPVLNYIQKDVIRVIATLFGPILVGAIVIPLLMIFFSLMGYQY